MRDGTHQVDPKQIVLADQLKEEGFVNPRHFHQAHEHAKPQGLDDESLSQLFEDIMERGITKPLILRVLNGQLQLVDGERRLRCALKGDLPAVPCYIYDEMTDDEAWTVAWRENDTSKAIGENATAALVKHWRECGWNDDKILTVTKRTPQWLRQMDTLGNLDPECFAAYTKGFLSLRVGLKLAVIDDMALRRELLEETLADAKADHEEWLAKQHKVISRIEDKMESAEARIVAAQLMGSEQEQEEAVKELAKHEEALQEANELLENEQTTIPVAKQKNLTRASRKVGARHVGSALSKSKIKKCLKQVDEYIENEGMDGDEFVGEVEHLQIVRHVLNTILLGNDDFKHMLSEYYDVVNGSKTESEETDESDVPFDSYEGYEDEEEDEDEEYDDDEYEEEEEVYDELREKVDDGDDD
jgi:hypothetical protein